ncbi:recombinase family protein [Clostridium perfringens]|uniref:recombinase family protein n=1 Tax=Clostridium perfringens TaxID=1502 RepID=UPI0013E3A93B|nr:recombinase family protein [Clostridium perfringens]NGT04430.1 recombinase family protein [Clostridium perfringens]
MKEIKLGYLRISTKEQNLERQIAALLKEGVELGNMYKDEQTGTNFDRPYYRDLKERIVDELIKDNGAHITVYVKELDRLGRSYKEIEDELRWFKLKNVNIKFLDLPWLEMLYADKENTMMQMVGEIVIKLMSYVAESEVKKMKQRQREAIDIILKNPELRAEKYKGRKPIAYPKNWDKVYNLYKDKQLTSAECMQMLGLKKTTFFKLAKQHKEKLEGEKCNGC